MYDLGQGPWTFPSQCSSDLGHGTTGMTSQSQRTCHGPELKSRIWESMRHFGLELISVQEEYERVGIFLESEAIVEENGLELG